MPHCAAIGCNFQSKGNKETDISLHSFPHDKKRRRAWEYACGRAQLPKDPRLCSRHFTPDAFESFSRLRLQKELIGTCYKRRLKPNAVPTIFFFNESNVGLQRPRTVSGNRAKKRARQEMLDTLLGFNSQSTAAIVALEVEPSDTYVTPIKGESDDVRADSINESVSPQKSPSKTDATTATGINTSDAAVQWPADAHYPVIKDHTYAGKHEVGLEKTSTTCLDLFLSDIQLKTG